MQSRDTFVTSLSSGDDNETLLDTIGQIEALNLTIDLPKVIVVGDEKSGKSSVMEALSGYPFPIDEDVCTTFPTEIVLTREPKSEGTTYKACIITKSKRWMSSLNNLGDFENGFSFEYGELSNVFQQAAHVLGVTIDGSERRFTDDTLRIEICGPNNPRLTLVDLPGIYQVGDRGNENGRDIVKSILRTYFEHDLSLVLLVWSATTWYHTSHAISVLENHTKVLNRTIGVMTHLDSDSVKQKKVLNIANNKELKLPMGWHSLVNLSQKDRKDGKTLSDRDDKEKIHFATNWKEINLRDKGIAALNTKLEQRVLETTQSHLTSLVASVKNALQMREKILESIGYERTTTEKRRNYLRNIAGEFKSLVESATYGYYLMNSEHASFYLDQNANVIPQRHLLARVRAMNQMFSIAMRYRGKANTLLDKGANDINEFMERTYQRKMYEAQSMYLNGISNT